MPGMEYANVRLTFASLLPFFFIVGCGAGIVLVPFTIAEFASQGIAWVLGAVLLTPLIHGVFAVILLLIGFPGYLLLARKRGGYVVTLVNVAKAGAGGGV